MRSQLQFLVCLAAAVFFVSACSSSTVSTRDQRPTVVPIEATVETQEVDNEAAVDDRAIDNEADADDPSNDEDQDRGDRSDGPAGDEAEDSLSPRELEEAEGFGLGGAEQIEGLLTDCDAGSDLACDVLFQLSDFNSPEEAAAMTCAGRSTDARAFCTDGIEPETGQLFFDIDSEGLDAIVTLCEDDGDLTACDFLYFRSPVESEFEEIGATCGGRVAVAVPDCRTFLAQ